MRVRIIEYQGWNNETYFRVEYVNNIFDRLTGWWPYRVCLSLSDAKTAARNLKYNVVKIHDIK